MTVSPYERFDRQRWSELRESTPLTLSETDLDRIRGVNAMLDLEEVRNIYLPLSRLLNLHIEAVRELAKVRDVFLGSASRPTPYMIGLAGSVAVGKSTAARLLQEVLASWTEHPKVDLVTTDGFLHPNAYLEEHDLMGHKGFPESFDTGALLEFLSKVRCGERAEAPVYSHLVYDIVPGERLVVDRPDVVIVEGLNVLQPGRGAGPFVSDFFDFTIYIDAPAEQIEEWYVDRFQTLRESVFTNPESYFRHFSDLDEATAEATARQIWNDINLPNLLHNIEPTRGRADLVLQKGTEHRVDEVRLRIA